jgi:hypothetical protein
LFIVFIFILCFNTYAEEIKLQSLVRGTLVTLDRNSEAIHLLASSYDLSIKKNDQCMNKAYHKISKLIDRILLSQGTVSKEHLLIRDNKEQEVNVSVVRKILVLPREMIFAIHKSKKNCSINSQQKADR